MAVAATSCSTTWHAFAWQEDMAKSFSQWDARILPCIVTFLRIRYRGAFHSSHLVFERRSLINSPPLPLPCYLRLSPAGCIPHFLFLPNAPTALQTCVSTVFMAKTVPFLAAPRMQKYAKDHAW